MGGGCYFSFDFDFLNKDMKKFLALFVFTEGNYYIL
jgi:hypothetical protein